MLPEEAAVEAGGDVGGAPEARQRLEVKVGGANVLAVGARGTLFALVLVAALHVVGQPIANLAETLSAVQRRDGDGRVASHALVRLGGRSHRAVRALQAHGVACLRDETWPAVVAHAGPREGSRSAEAAVGAQGHAGHVVELAWAARLARLGLLYCYVAPSLARLTLGRAQHVRVPAFGAVFANTGTTDSGTAATDKGTAVTDAATEGGTLTGGRGGVDKTATTVVHYPTPATSYARAELQDVVTRDPVVTPG